MIWPLFGLVALAALAPLVLAILRPARARGRREADLALYRAQLAELDREREAGRLDAVAHQAATIEIQRRILSVPEEGGGGEMGRRTAATLLAALFLIPAGGLGLYLLRGNPELPAAPFEERQAAQARDDELIANLRTRLEAMDPRSEQARGGWILLGNAERSRGQADRAAEAWTRALEVRFDPNLAADLAELEIERGNGPVVAVLLTRALADAPQDPRLRFLTGLAEARAGRNTNARATWQALLADAPADAPWRGVVERQLQNLQ
ncbi:MAG TPA: c-type cytochrome biogenesis protein CcmI [Acetobacteraceae bacterium]|nr:c-type cytochrome biogenesis protein CcmI [Acetobacteraceae bacterium]